MDSHLKLVDKTINSGNIILGGSFFPNDGALLILSCQDEIVVDDFVKNDPYYINGLVSNYEIKEIEMFSKIRVDELALYYKYR